MRYAVVNEEDVINVIEWDGETEYDPGEENDLFLLEENQSVGPGWKRVEGQWVEPPLEEEPND